MTKLAAAIATVCAAFAALAGGGPKLCVPASYKLTAGDGFELFYRGIVRAADPYHYNLKVISTVGSDYARKFAWIPSPADAGSHRVTLELRDDADTLLDRAEFTLDVAPVPASPARPFTVLVIGDSLTSTGLWVAELERRICGSGGEPAGLGLSGVRFAGPFRCGKAAAHCAVTGADFDFFASDRPDNPLWNPETHRADPARAVAGTPDVCYIFLGWNCLLAGTSDAAYRRGALKLAEELRSAWPKCTLVFVGLQVPSRNGLGEKYGCKYNYFDIMSKVFELDALNRAVAGELGNADTVSLAGQFDSENNMPLAGRYPNLRSDRGRLEGVNGIHPAEPGLMQIADAVFRDLAWRLNRKNANLK